jgi:hypothetical protein
MEMTKYDDEIQRVRAIHESMEGGARPGFDDEDIENLRILIRLTVEFYDYLTSTPPWPAFPDDLFHDLTYKSDSILWNVDSFLRVLHAYNILVGSTQSAIDWKSINLGSLEGMFLSIYDAFLRETIFESKCRLLLDLFKLQIVFAGAFYDCRP